MSKRPSRLAELDIEGEGLAQQDGLAERLARQRDRAGEGRGQNKEGPSPRPTPLVRDANAWRRGKSLLQVAILEDDHVELSIIAKRRRLTVSQLMKDALNEWLTSHGHELRIKN